MSLCSVCLHGLLEDYIFIQNCLLGSGSLNRLNFSPVSFELVLSKAFCSALPVLVITGFISKKHGSVVECYVHVCWYTVL